MRMVRLRVPPLHVAEHVVQAFHSLTQSTSLGTPVCRDSSRLVMDCRPQVELRKQQEQAKNTSRHIWKLSGMAGECYLDVERAANYGAASLFLVPRAWVAGVPWGPNHKNECAGSYFPLNTLVRVVLQQNVCPVDGRLWASQHVSCLMSVLCFWADLTRGQTFECPAVDMCQLIRPDQGL